MSSSPEYVEFVAEQLSDAGEITYRKMFGEYGIYCNGIFFGCVCDNQLFVKITDPGREFMPDGETAPPYAGAKPCFRIEDLDDPGFLKELTQIICAALPVKKPKKRGRQTAPE